MQRNLLLLADLHLHQSPLWRLEWLIKFIDQLLEQQHTDFKGMDLVLVGDVTESRDYLDSRVANLLIKLISGWKTGRVIWICGQHDSYQPGVATLGALALADLCIVVDKELWHDEKTDTWFVPFARKVEYFREMLAKVPDGATVVTHMPTKEIIEMYGGKSPDGISVEEFGRFGHTYSGDIHKFYDFPKFSYVGAPSQRDWRDKGCDGQIGTLVGNVFTRIPTKHPIHIEVKTKEEIPQGVDCIIRAPKGLVTADQSNVLGATTSTEYKPESIQVGEINSPKLISEYAQKNKLDGIALAEVESFAREALTKAESVEE